MDEFKDVKISDVPYSVDQITYVELIRFKRNGPRLDVYRDLFNPYSHKTLKNISNISSNSPGSYTPYIRNYPANYLTETTYDLGLYPGLSIILISHDLSVERVTSYLNSGNEILPRRYTINYDLSEIKSQDAELPSEEIDNAIKLKPKPGQLIRNYDGLGFNQSGDVPTGTPPVITSGDVVTVEAESSTKYEITSSGSFPISINVEHDLSFVTKYDDYIYFTPTFSDEGEHALTITAHNDYGISTKSVIINVIRSGALPKIAPSPEIRFLINEEIRYLIPFTGFNPIVFTAVGLPDFATIGPSTGVITGFASGTGTFNVSVTAQNAYGSTTANFIMHIGAPSIGEPTILIKKLNVGYGLNVTRRIPVRGLGDISITVGSLPEFISFSDEHLVIHNTAPLGIFNVDVTAQSIYGIDRQVIEITISNDAPKLTFPSVINTTSGKIYRSFVKATGSGDVSVTILNAPSFVTIANNFITINPSVNQFGSYSFQVIATNQYGTDIVNVSLSVTGLPPIITSKASINAEIGVTTTYTINAYGSGVMAYKVTSTLPPYITLSGKVLTIKPTSNDAGTTVNVLVTNAYGQATKAVKITTLTKPVITSSSTVSLQAGQSVNYTLTAIGSLPIRYSIVSGVAFATLYNNVVTISPSLSIVGTFNLIVRATNDAGFYDKTIQISVEGILPTITSARTVSILVGQSTTYLITAAGTPTITFTTANLPSFVTKINNTLSIQPPLTTIPDSYSLEITASNPVGISVLVLSIVVSGNAPVITSATTVSGTLNQVTEYVMTASGSPPIVFTTSTLPSVITRTGNSLYYEPTSIGDVTISITATNSAGSNTRAITFSSIPTPPKITSSTSISVNDGVQTTYQITATGNPTPTYTFSGDTSILVGTPAGGLITFKTDGSKTSYSIIITATNEAGTDSINLIIDASGIAPTITSATSINAPLASYAGNTIYTITGGGNNVTYTTSTLPNFATKTGSTITFAPTTNSYGTYDITVTATNVFGTVSITLTVTAFGPPVITSSLAISRTVGSDVNYAIAATGFGPISYAIVGAPTFVTLLDNSTGVLTGTVTGSEGVSYSSTISAINAAGATTATLVINVVGMPVITSDTSHDVFKLRGFAGTLYEATATGGAIVWSLSGAPNFVTINSSSGLVSSTAIPTMNGYNHEAYTFSIIATNSVGSATKSLTLNTGSAPIITLADNTEFNVPGSTVKTITLVDDVPVASGTYWFVGSVKRKNSFTITVATVSSTFWFGRGGSQSYSLTSDGSGLFTNQPIISGYLLTAGGSGHSYATYEATAFGAESPQFAATTGLIPDTSSNAILTVNFQLPYDDHYDYTTYTTPTFAALPPWGSSSVVSGKTVITLSPPSNVSGTYYITVTAANEFGYDDVPLMITTDGFPHITPYNNIVTSYYNQNGTSGFNTVYQLNATGAKPVGYALESKNKFLIEVPALNAVYYFGRSGSTTEYSITTDGSGLISSASTIPGYSIVAGGVGYTSITYEADASGIQDPQFAGDPSTSGLGNLTITTFGTSNTASSWVSIVGDYVYMSPSIDEIAGVALTITATNAYGTDQAPLSISVSEGTPYITSSATKNAFIGVSTTYTITTSGRPSSGLAPITYTATYLGGALPSFMTRSGNVITINATQSTSQGDYVIALNASNIHGSNGKTLTITVSDIPTITSATTISRNLEVPINYTITATGLGTITYGLSGAPYWVTVNTNTGVLSGNTPAIAGSASFVITATNAAGTKSVTLTLVYNANIPYISSSSTFSVFEGTSTTYTITSLGAATLTYNATYNGGALPTGWSRSGNVITILAQYLQTSLLGTNYIISVTATNSFGTDTKLVTFTAYGPVEITTPATDPFNLAVSPSDVVSYSIVATGGGTKTYGLIGNPGWLSINSSTGALIGTTPGSPGADTFTVTAQNQASTGDSITMTITYTIPPTITSSTSAIYVWRGYDLSNGKWAAGSLVPGAYTATATGGSITWSLTGHPTWMSIDSATGQLQGTPDTINAEGYDTYTFNIVATNPGGTDTKSLTIYAGDPCRINGGGITGAGEAVASASGYAYFKYEEVPYIYVVFITDAPLDIMDPPPYTGINVGGYYIWRPNYIYGFIDLSTMITGSKLATWSPGGPNVSKWNISFEQIDVGHPIGGGSLMVMEEVEPGYEAILYSYIMTLNINDTDAKDPGLTPSSLGLDGTYNTLALLGGNYFRGSTGRFYLYAENAFGKAKADFSISFDADIGDY